MATIPVPNQSSTSSSSTVRDGGPSTTRRRFDQGEQDVTRPTTSSDLRVSSLGPLDRVKNSR